MFYMAKSHATPREVGARLLAGRIASGNMGGRPKSLTTLRREADKDAREKFLAFASTQVLPIGDALVEKAKTGDIQAVKEFFDRTWGKAPQSVEISGEVTFSLRALNNSARNIAPAEVLRIDAPEE